MYPKHIATFNSRHFRRVFTCSELCTCREYSRLARPVRRVAWTLAWNQPAGGCRSTWEENTSSTKEWRRRYNSPSVQPRVPCAAADLKLQLRLTIINQLRPLKKKESHVTRRIRVGRPPPSRGRHFTANNYVVRTTFFTTNSLQSITEGFN